MLDDDFFTKKYYEDLRNMQNNNLANQRNQDLIKSNLLIKSSIDTLKQENSKLVEENKKLVEELKKQNEVIKSLKQRWWHFWIPVLVSSVAAIGSILACILPLIA